MSSPPQICVKCGGALQTSSTVCEACGSIQPARAGETLFDVLGVARAFPQELRELETRYKALSRRLHPDRFAKAEPASRMLSLKRATDLNHAYKTLKDPVKRAEYLLLLDGVDLGREDRPGAAKVDPELLVSIMELREALMDAKLEGDRAALETMTADVRGRAEQAMRDVTSGFADGEVSRVAEALIALRYYRRFLDEVEAGDEAAFAHAQEEAS